MSGGDRGSQLSRPRTIVDEKTKRDFAAEYLATGASKRRVFDEYLDSLGAEELLDFLETRYPLCRSQAHELGRVIFARLRDLGPALNVCQTRCTSGCMHGVLMEAFARARPGPADSAQDQPVALHEVEKQMVQLCSGKGEMAKMYKPGNCAHGMGHALMIVAGHDVERSLAACRAFEQPGMEYYCATGVFMEYFGSVGPDNVGQGALHAPCDTYTRFPAACYRYRIRQVMVALKWNWSAVVAECLKHPRRQRLGCFHGLGSAATPVIAEKPGFLTDVCHHGTAEDQALCIEGAIEKLADVNESKALIVCSSLSGRNADLCRTAARGKMYRLNKPTMPLYYAQQLP